MKHILKAVLPFSQLLVDYLLAVDACIPVEHFEAPVNELLNLLQVVPRVILPNVISARKGHAVVLVGNNIISPISQLCYEWGWPLLLNSLSVFIELLQSSLW